MKETFWQLATHLVYDIMHFDSRFFGTLKYLLVRPGFLSKEYLRGRRASYLHPIRMYVFTSAIFFILFFAFVVQPDEMEKNARTTEAGISTRGKQNLEQQIRLLQDSLSRTKDPRQYKKVEQALNTLQQVATYVPVSEETNDTTGKTRENHFFDFRSHMPKTAGQYDSLQQKLPEQERDGWLMRIVMYRTIAINQKYKGDDERLKEDFFEKFKHSVPQMMFLSLPLLALVLQLLYVRRRKQFFYVDHVVLLIHVYIAVFISLLIYYALDGLHQWTGFAPFGWLGAITGLYLFVYPAAAMYRFYGQGVVKTGLKYIILLSIGSMLTLLLVVIFIITSFFQI